PILNPVGAGESTREDAAASLRNPLRDGLSASETWCNLLMGYLLLCGSRSRSTTGRGAEQGSPRHSTFSALHIYVKKTKQRNVRASGADPPSLSAATHGSCLRQEPNAETRSSLPWRGLWATMIR